MESVTPEDVVRALAAWSIRLVQFNGLVADRMGVTASDLQCLYELAHHGPSTAGTLARRVNLTTGSASRMIDRLVAAGLVRRVPDPADRRRIVVEPDPASLERVGALYGPLNDRLAADLEGSGRRRSPRWRTSSSRPSAPPRMSSRACDGATSSQAERPAGRTAYPRADAPLDAPSRRRGTARSAGGPTCLRCRGALGEMVAPDRRPDPARARRLGAR